MASTPQPAPFADLPPDLLGQVIALLPFPADRARFRAVCRSWHSAMREHAGTQLPWILHSDGAFVTPPYYDLHNWSPFPDGTKLIGATNSWLALYRTHADDGRRRYLLHNPFTKKTVPLPALDSIIGKVPDPFEIEKVLMRSTEDDIVAVMTNMRNCRIILCRPRKSGAWLLKRRVLPYAIISDIAFIGGSLYGVTKDADLITLEIGEKKDGTPTVTSAKYVIRQYQGEGDDDDSEQDDEDEVEVSSSEDDADDHSEQDGEDEVEVSSSEDDDSEQDGEDEVQVSSSEDEEDDDSDASSYEDGEGASASEDVDEDLESIEESDNDEDSEFDGYCTNPDTTVENEYMDYTVTERRLLESAGKLLMVRRQHFIPSSTTRLGRDIKDKSELDDDSDLEVLEADLHVGSWVPAAGSGMLFIGDHFSTSVFGCKEATEEFICHFVDENDVVDTIPKTYEELLESKSMWFSPLEIVV